MAQKKKTANTTASSFHFFAEFTASCRFVGDKHLSVASCQNQYRHHRRSYVGGAGQRLLVAFTLNSGLSDRCSYSESDYLKPNRNVFSILHRLSWTQGGGGVPVWASRDILRVQHVCIVLYSHYYFWNYNVPCTRALKER